MVQVARNGPVMAMRSSARVNTARLVCIKARPDRVTEYLIVAKRKRWYFACPKYSDDGAALLVMHPSMFSRVA